MPKGIFEKLHLYRVIIIGYSLFVLGILVFLTPFIIDLTNGQEAFLRVLGTAFLSGGLISLINEHFLRHSMIDEMSERFDAFLSDNIDDLYRRRPPRAFLYERNPTQKICDAIERAQHSVLLLNNWIPDFDGLHRGLKVAIRKGVEIRILLLNPDSQFTRIRGSEIGGPDPTLLESYIRLELHNIVEFLNEDENKGSACVKVWLFDELPGLPLYATESEMFIGWYFKGKRAVTCPTIRIKGKQLPLYREMEATFNRMWQAHTTSRFYPTP